MPKSSLLRTATIVALLMASLMLGSIAAELLGHAVESRAQIRPGNELETS